MTEITSSSPLFVHLLDPKLVRKPRYLEGAIAGFYNQTDPELVEHLYYREGAIEGMRLWKEVFCESEVDHSQRFVERFISDRRIESQLEAGADMISLTSLSRSDLSATSRAAQWLHGKLSSEDPAAPPDEVILHALC